MKRNKVLYFTIVALGRTDNGGGLICRHHAQRIAETEDVDLTVCTAGSPERREQERSFADAIGASYKPIDFLDAPRQQGSRWPFLFETDAQTQGHVDGEFGAILDNQGPDILVVDYLYSAAFIPSAFRRSNLHRIIITLNREIAFFKELKRLNGLPEGTSSSTIAELRLFLFEQSIYSRSHHVVALCPEDLPFPRPTMHRAVIRPIFDQKEQRWAGENSRDLFFVGNIGHYPNRLAVEWIVDRLSPALESISSPAVINVIGASADQFGNRQLLSNLRLHGTASNAEVADRFGNCGLFVAPIENNYGSKIKLLDCLSMGTPFAGTEGALSGLPFLAGIPIFDLADPLAAAKLLTTLLHDPAKRRSISSTISGQVEVQLLLQKDAWQAALAAAP
jgi:hypothetical protein